MPLGKLCMHVQFESKKKVYYVLEQNLLYPGLQGQNLFSYKCRSKPAITVVLTSKKKKNWQHIL